MTVNGNGNGNSSSRVLKAGVWAPIPTFFDDSEELGTYPLRSSVFSDLSTTRLCFYLAVH
jgi:hypothetical protein